MRCPTGGGFTSQPWWGGGATGGGAAGRGDGDGGGGDVGGGDGGDGVAPAVQAEMNTSSIAICERRRR